VKIAETIHPDLPADHGRRLPHEISAQIVAAWAHDAAMEHASIASFARFTLELLAVGAPPKLLLASQDAARDEVQHALKCFTIASRLAGKRLGPGPLDVAGVAPACGLESVVTATVKEGCIAETLSAVLARERSEGDRDEELRTALSKIAEDEGRHAELAWRFVAWAVERGGAPIRAAALRAFDEAMEHPPSGFNPVLRDVPREQVRAYGLLDEAAAHAVTRRALVDVITPRVASLRAVIGCHRAPHEGG